MPFLIACTISGSTLVWLSKDSKSGIPPLLEKKALIKKVINCVVSTRSIRKMKTVPIPNASTLIPSEITESDKIKLYYKVG